MFGKMMNRYYYGKSGKGDYTKDDLPETRWQLFWEMLRVRFSGLFRLNLMYMIAWIPVMYVLGRGLTMLYSGLINLAELQAQVQAGEATVEAYTQMYGDFTAALQAILMQTLMLFFPAMAITGPATAGLAYVTRNWARDEHAFIWSDFIDALKANWKQSLITSAITGFMPLLMYVCFTFYGDMAKDNMFFMVPQVLVVSLGSVWLCSLMYMYPQIVTYKLSYRGIVRNSLMMAIARLPMTVAFKLLSLVPALIVVVVSLLTPYMQVALLVLLMYYVLIGFSLSRFIQASYTNAVFDKYINVNIEGAEVGRGLYRESEDEEEEETAESSESADL